MLLLISVRFFHFLRSKSERMPKFLPLPIRETPSTEILLYLQGLFHSFLCLPLKHFGDCTDTISNVKKANHSQGWDAKPRDLAPISGSPGYHWSSQCTDPVAPILRTRMGFFLPWALSDYLNNLDHGRSRKMKKNEPHQLTHNEEDPARWQNKLRSRQS